jgi:hypothetical protein
LRFIGKPVLSDDPCGAFGILAAATVDIPGAAKAVGGPLLLGFVALAGAGLVLVHLALMFGGYSGFLKIELQFVIQVICFFQLDAVPDHDGKDKPDLDSMLPVWQLKTTRTFSSSED